MQKPTGVGTAQRTEAAGAPTRTSAAMRSADHPGGSSFGCWYFGTERYVALLESGQHTAAPGSASRAAAISACQPSVTSVSAVEVRWSAPCGAGRRPRVGAGDEAAILGAVIRCTSAFSRAEAGEERGDGRVGARIVHDDDRRARGPVATRATRGSARHRRPVEHRHYNGERFHHRSL
jgi:hypothetical protein